MNGDAIGILVACRDCGNLPRRLTTMAIPREPHGRVDLSTRSRAISVSVGTLGYMNVNGRGRRHGDGLPAWCTARGHLQPRAATWKVDPCTGRNTRRLRLDPSEVAVAPWVFSALGLNDTWRHRPLAHVRLYMDMTAVRTSVDADWAFGRAFSGISSRRHRWLLLLHFTQVSGILGDSITTARRLRDMGARLHGADFAPVAI